MRKFYFDVERDRYNIKCKMFMPKCQIRLIDVKGASHRFKGPGELEFVVTETVKWLGEE